MRVLFLGPASPTLTFLRERENVVATEEPLDVETAGRFDLFVSHGYRHIIREPVLSLIERRAVNLHISLLPWNRGADPNLWSWLEQTPKGVTIHYIDAGVDTGPIVAQREVALDGGGTLASTYAELQAAMTGLFVERWPEICAGDPGRAQRGKGSYHAVADKARVEHLLTDGWSTPVRALAPSVRAS